MMNDPIKKPVKLLVGHENPDLDVIGSVWLFLRFGGRDFEQCQFYFVRAGEMIDPEVLQLREIAQDEVVHVDTGLGVFDHHQPGNREHDSATLRVFHYLCKKFPDLGKDEALRRLVNFINETDHFGSFFWPEPTDDRYLFGLEEILNGLRGGKQFTDREVVDFGVICLDGVYTSLKVRVAAEEDLRKLGQEFETQWGKALAIENSNDEVIKLAQKQGYRVVVRKDKDQGNVRIKAVPEPGITLKAVFDKIVATDRQGMWYYHPSGHMVLNGSKKNTGQEPTRLSLKEVVKIIQEIKKE